jgi:predicted CXXCH cytochrome family protein
MIKRTKLNQGTIKALLAGLLVWALCMGGAVHAAWAASGQQPLGQEGGTGTPQPEETAEAEEAASMQAVPSKDCAECHLDIHTDWMESPHAYAFDDPVFLERWNSLGEPGDCLVCHTTGYQATTTEYAAEGVTCEACHGKVVEGHPPAVIPVRGDTEYCGTCHTTTIGEWRLSGHASASVGCTDCHNPHSQGALFEDPDELCINCHKDDIGEHKEDTHLALGIGCVECHGLVLPMETPPLDGLVPTGHTFTITPATCVSCHTDTLRIGKPLPGYEAGAKAVAANSSSPSTVSTVVAEYTGEATGTGSLPSEQAVQAMEAALASARLSTLFQGGIIGLVLGGSTAYFFARNTSRRSKAVEIENGETESLEGPEDV